MRVEPRAAPLNDHAKVVYNTTINNTNLFTVEAIIFKSGFQSFKQWPCAYGHEGIILRHIKVEVRHSNTYSAPPYRFFLLVVPLLL